MVYYANGFTADSVHKDNWNFVKGDTYEPHPNVSYDFYSWLWGENIDK